MRRSQKLNSQEKVVKKTTSKSEITMLSAKNVSNDIREFQTANFRYFLLNCRFLPIARVEKILFHYLHRLNFYTEVKRNFATHSDLLLQIKHRERHLKT